MPEAKLEQLKAVAAARGVRVDQIILEAVRVVLDAEEKGGAPAASEPAGAAREPWPKEVKVSTSVEAARPTNVDDVILALAAVKEGIENGTAVGEMIELLSEAGGALASAPSGDAWAALNSFTPRPGWKEERLEEVAIILRYLPEAIWARHAILQGCMALLPTSSRAFASDPLAMRVSQAENLLSLHLKTLDGSLDKLGERQERPTEGRQA